MILLLLMPAPSLAGMRLAVRGQDPQTIARYLQQLPVGAEVEVRLADRTTFRGFLIAAEEGTLVVMPKTRVPVPQRRLPFDAIEFVELRSGRGGIGPGAAVGIGVAVGAAAFFALVLVAVAAAD
jgi:hypothetical protein